MTRLPLFVRKAILDFAETAVPALLGLTFAGDTAALAHAALVAVGAALVSAARRETPGFLDFLRGVLQVPAE